MADKKKETKKTETKAPAKTTENAAAAENPVKTSPLSLRDR